MDSVKVLFMSEPISVTYERVDDLPLLLEQQKRMGVQPLLDKHFPTHGNWQGLSLGWVASIWLGHILSQADHRLSYVQPWAEKRLSTLSICTGQSVRALDLSDDRLEAVLGYLSEDEPWHRFEEELGGHLVRVYDLKAERVRLDPTTASGYCGVSEDGLFQWGHSKNKRPDLAQVKIMLATLDPLALPVASEVLSGEKADDPLYVPAIKRVRETLLRNGLLYIGDCKMAAIATRGELEAGGDYYLCPLPATQLATGELLSYLQPVWSGIQQLTEVEYDYANGETKKIAVGYEISIPRSINIDGVEVTWSERQLVVKSLAAAVAGSKSLQTRLEKAQTALEELGQSRRGKKRLIQLGDWQEAAEGICRRYRVQGLLHLDYQVTTRERQLRPYRDRPARVVVESSVELSVTLDEAALEHQKSMLGWRVYVTNQPPQELSLRSAVVAYREEYLIERGFGRFKGFPLSLTPIYLQRDDYVKGLIRLLSIGLRVLTLLEFQVRRGLAGQQEKLSGLYPGNPKRATARPTAEQLLAAFCDITLLLIDKSNPTYVHLSSLSPLQQQILTLLNFDLEIYNQLGPEMLKPP